MSGTARAHYVLAHVILAGALLQFLLGGSLIFGADLGELHFPIGYLLVLLSLIALVLAGLSRRALPWTAALFVAVVVQLVLPQFRESAPIIAALHPLNAVLVVFLAVSVFRGAPPSLRSIERGGGGGELGQPGETATTGARPRVR